MTTTFSSSRWRRFPRCESRCRPHHRSQHCGEEQYAWVGEDRVQRLNTKPKRERVAMERGFSLCLQLNRPGPIRRSVCAWLHSTTLPCERTLATHSRPLRFQAATLLLISSTDLHVWKRPKQVSVNSSHARAFPCINSTNPRAILYQTPRRCSSWPRARPRANTSMSRALGNILNF